MELQKLQRIKLHRIIKHAYENVEYYRNLFDSVGVTPKEIRTVEDLPKIPITPKSTLQSLPTDEIIAKNVSLRKCLTVRTSGSQGRPLTIYWRKQDKAFLDMVWNRAKFENGQRLTDKCVSIFPIPMIGNNWSPRWSMQRKVNISCFDDIGRQLDILETFRPQVITGYPSHLRLLANAIKEQSNKQIHPRLIFTTAELLDRNSRNLIASAFGSQVFDLYGTMELHNIAWECGEKLGYHVNIDSVVVEFVWHGKNVGSGERGHLICTGLHSYAMPFIRYEIGDIGVRSNRKCSCARGFPLMKIIEGRAVDFIIKPNGKILSPYLLTGALENILGIAKYQVIQEKKDRVVVLIVKNRELVQDIMTLAKRNLEKLLGRNVAVEVKIVDEIPNDKSGKFHVVLSKLEEGL